MSKVTIDLFAEDRAHEEFLRALTRRIAREEQAEVTLRVRSARGGHGRALEEFALYQRAVDRGAMERPDILVVAIDSNCRKLSQARGAIRARTDAANQDRTVIACPDPHVERWYMADPDSFHSVVGHLPALGKKKCERGWYKNLLAHAVRSGGHVSTLGGVEFAQDLVEAMDLYRAGKTDPALRAFVTDARASIRNLVQRQAEEA